MAVRPDLAAVVLAAGYSRRMGAFKPLLAFGSTTVIERVIATISEAGVETIRVVVGWKADRLIPVLERSHVPWIKNERYAEGMYGSVQAGVQSLPTGVAAFFLLPGDMPSVQGATLIRLIADWDARPGGIRYPCHEGKRGHPPLIAGAHIPEILRETPSSGLREILARHTQNAREIECGDPGILIDLDTPDEYRQSVEKRDLA